jgi:uncharacterized protein (TIGR02246 family)
VTPNSSETSEPLSGDEGSVRSLYQELLACWNRRDAEGFAALFAEDGASVGFDGSSLNGPAEIATVLRQIFANHPTAAYVSIVRGIRFPTADVAILRADAGMIPPGQSDVNPAVNAIQVLVSVKQDGRWRITHFQNTPAAFHGRPELAERLTEELRSVLRAS